MRSPDRPPTTSIHSSPDSVLRTWAMKLHEAARMRVPVTSTGSPRRSPAQRSVRASFDAVVEAPVAGGRRRLATTTAQDRGLDGESARIFWIRWTTARATTMTAMAATVSEA